MITLILHNDWGMFEEKQRWQLDVKPDVHVSRVFQRTGLIYYSDSPNEAKRTAWMLNPDFPGELDWPAVNIGQNWCHAEFEKRNCKECPLEGVCPSSLTKT